MQRAQQADGSFTGMGSRSYQPFVPSTEHRTVFVPALMLGALADCEPALPVRQRLAAWLLSQKSPHWSFNYWASDSAERAGTPYPDDLDDTFCALLGLQRHDPTLIDETCLGHVVKLLLATESQVGGPYRTWLASADAAPPWRDIDLAVNSNIVCFLRRVAQPLPNLTALIEQAIDAASFQSPYYPSAWPLLYYAARAYDGPKQAALRRLFLQTKPQTPLENALAITSLLQLGAKPAALAATVKQLLAGQEKDGSWAAEAFWKDTEFHGAAALTTALAIEALTAYAQTTVQPSRDKPKAQDETAAQLYAAILESVQHDANLLPEPLAASAIATLEFMSRTTNRQEIVLLPYFFSSLVTQQPSLLGLCQELGRANLYGWIAYTIYDDFLDDEGQPRLLPVANWAMRRSLTAFRQALPGQAAFQAYVERVFNTIDAANAWEIAHCRFKIEEGSVVVQRLPVFGSVQRLAGRSLGHALTPLGLLCAGGLSLQAPPAKALRQALTHYLTARQLHDDLHDWEDDLRAGCCSYVVADVLRGAHIAAGRHAFQTIMPQLQAQFWRRSLAKLCRTMLKQLSLARQQLEQSGLAERAPAFIHLIDDLEASAHRTQAEQTSAEKFLTAYLST